MKNLYRRILPSVPPSRPKSVRNRFIDFLTIDFYQIHCFSSLSGRAKRGKRQREKKGHALLFTVLQHRVHGWVTFYNDLEFTLMRLCGAEGMREHVDGRTEVAKRLAALPRPISSSTSALRERSCIQIEEARDRPRLRESLGL